MKGREEGGGPSPIATWSEEGLCLRQPFDATGVMDMMAFGLRCVEEIVIDGEKADATIEGGTEAFDTRGEGEFGEDESAAPQP